MAERQKADVVENTDELRRLTLTLPESLLIAVDEKILQLRKSGKRISFSALVEVCLREMIKSNNLAALISRDGLSARRKPKKVTTLR
jgi:hypothetical protein